MGDVLTPLIIIGVLILLNGLFVAAEFCIIGARPTRIAQLADEGNPAAVHVQQVLSTPVLMDRYIATAQIGITIASLSLGMYGEHTVAIWLLGPLEHWLHLSPAAAHSITFVVAVSLLTFAHVVVGEMIPKSLALQYAEQTALGIDSPMRMMKRLFFPLTLVLNGIGNLLLWLLRIPPASSTHRLYSPEELELVVTESHKEGLLSDDERQIIERIFDLDERRVGQVMTPRPRIAAIPLETSEDELRELVANSPHSRFPVYQGDLDHVVGLLLAKDFVSQQIDPAADFDLQSMLRHMPAVPEAMTCERLLAAFKCSHIHMALVFDEYGGTAGVVTLEDLLEEVVGEVRDEFDHLEQPPLHQVSPGVLLARGDLMLDHLQEHTPGIFPTNEEDDMPDGDTVGGLVVSLLGRPATPGDHVAFFGTTFTVESVHGYAVDMVRIVLNPELLNTPDNHREQEPLPNPER